MSTLRELRMYGRFMVGLPAFFRRRITVEQAEAAVRLGLAEREANLLRLARRGIYDNPRSPYRKLLEMAGCTYGDLESSVRTKGLEPTLRALRAEGVYVTFEEYKGRQPLVRGGQTFEIDPHDFDNPLATRAYAGTTGGSTGAGTRVETDLDNIYALTQHVMIGRDVHGVLTLPGAVWKGTLPDPIGVQVLLGSVLYQNIPQRWFTPVTRDDYVPPLRFRMATQYILWMSRLCGARFPWPEPLPVDQAIVLARWAADAVKTHGGCQVVSSVSLGMRVCIAAKEAGLDLTGANFFGGGEPITPAKMAAFSAVGARHITIYVSVDAGVLGLPCANPAEDNDQHLLEDNVALIQHPRALLGSDIEVDAFYFTSLCDRSSKILFNMESDDYGVVEERACGCRLETLGYRRHLRQIRSYGKLTGEGVTLVGSEMIRILEHVLPSTYGGTTQDYQLLEEHDEQGFTRLVLLIDPKVPISSEQAVIDTMLDALKAGSEAGGLTQSFWKRAGTFRIRRQPPVWTARGKLPLIVRGAP
ncbi:MAG TPA: hypothetical protein VLA20_04855 [Vicinamibacterales bacterium]|nr:hypothetical protein [Vicinamibacterales bacterium]